MAKTRVYELARELKIESRLLVTRIKDLGITVASHQSTLSDAQVMEIRKALSGGQTASKASSPKKTVIRRRRPAAKEEAAAQEPEAEAVEVQEAVAEEAAPIAEEVVPPTEAKASKVQQEATPAEEVSEAVEAQASTPEVTTAPEVEKAPEAISKTPVEPAPEKVEGAKVISRRSEEDAPEAPKEVAKKGATEAVSAEPLKKAVAKSEAEVKPRTPVSSGGAKIVRRATPEEVANSRLAAERAAEVRRAKKPRRESRPYEGQSEAPAYTPPRREQKPSSPGASAGPGRPPSAPTVPDSSEPLGGIDGANKRGHARVKKKTVDEEAAAPRRPAFVKTRREGFNTRSILDTSGGQLEENRGHQSNKKKMVYTPSAQNRRRDFKRRKDLKKTEVTTPRAAYRVVKMGDEISVSELGKQMGVKATELIKKLIGQGVMVTINQNIDFDTATLMAGEYKFEVQSNKVSVDDLIDKGFNSGSEGELEERPPIVTIMGHVDHGKTSILDAIRKAKVASGEAGGITQHIGAYSVTSTNGKKISFLDTPGHEAFSAMRQRGAKVTDIVVLVVAADDGVMPQTVEAISHARDAEVPIIVAINKIDKPNVNFDRVFTELTEHGVQSEEWGGDTQFIKVSALEGTGLDDLLDAIALQSEMLELRASAKGDGQGIVVEGHLDGGRGPIATVMVQSGTLTIGDLIVAGQSIGKVRAMHSDAGKKIQFAGPSTPVEIIGLDSVPMAGDPVHRFVDDKAAKEVVAFRKRKLTEGVATSAIATLDALLGRVKDEERPVVPVIIKGDTQGSVEAIIESLAKLNTDRVENKIVHKAVGGISESDVRLASTSGSVIIGFNVRLGRGLTELADRYGVPIEYFSVIYEVVDAVKSLMAGTLPPIQTEVVQGHGEVRQTIKVPKIGTVAGTAILDGKITRNSSMRLIRDDVVIFIGKVGSLRRFKDDVKEVSHGYECGIGIEGCNDIREGDVIESFIIEEEVATL